ncbi:MAG: translocator protein [Patescibacteria group bacterium]|nr:translocator protein [Patescibacteria group bacterium]
MKKILISLLILIIFVFGLVFLLDKKDTILPDDDEQVFCTQEALMCPDGSYVGRSGSKCEFTICPNSQSFKGKLSQQGGEFFLIMGAPLGTIEEVSYSLPLQIKISNVLGTIVGKEVVVKGNFITGNTLEVESLEEVNKEVSNTVKIKIGETKYSNGVRITLNKMVSESRCAQDVQCITAGFVYFEVVLKSDTDEEKVVLASDKPAHPFDSFKISIINVSPVPLSTSLLDPKKYEVTFKVDNL